MKNNSLKRLMAAALCLCMLLSLYVPSVSAETVSYHDMSMSQLLALDEDLTWVFTGDSITHNGSWTGGYNDYAAWFEKYLYDIGRGDDTLINSAWGGAAIDHFLPTRSGSDGMGLDNFVTKYNPDVVFIKLGMNNRLMDDATFASKYNAMLDGIYEAGAKNGKKPKVILLSPTPLSGEFGISSGEFGSDPTTSGYYDSVKRFSNNLSNIASQRGLLFVDLRQAMVDESAVLGDRFHYTFFSDPSDGRIHPNGAGQYFMFKTICKTLGLYNSAMPIFNVSYDDIVNAALYSDSTAIGYTGSYGIDYTGPSDATEMNKDMPGLEKNTQPVLLASVDFDSTNGEIIYNSTNINAGTVDLTDANVMDDALTLAEAQTMGKEYSIVFRYKSNVPSGRNNLPLLYMASTKSGSFQKQEDKLLMGMPGASNIYYQVYKDGTNIATHAGGTTYFGNLRTEMNDGEWHTIAVVQSTSGLTYYVDGTAYNVAKNENGAAITISSNIGDMFADTAEDDFDAVFGRYGISDSNWKTQGNFDYWQLYNGALSAAEVATLTSNGGKVEDATQMNKTMPTVTDVNALASVDFTSATGVFAGTGDYASSTRVDLTDETVVDDALTLEEVQGMGREFSLVLRARLDSTTHQVHQALLMLTPGTDARWTNAISIGGPGTANNLYYEVRQTVGETTSELTNSSNVIGLAATTPNVVDAWHTIAIVQRTDGLDYYIDGVLAESKSYKLKDGLTFGDLFTDATEFTAHVGSFAQGDAKTYNLKAKLDYYQFYGTALTAAQVASLGSGVVSDADQMNATMPTLPAVEYVPNLLASVDFTNENGIFSGWDNYTEATRFDLTKEAEGVNTFTLAEAQSLGKTFSVVFRAKLNISNQDTQAVFFASATGTKDWNDAITLNAAGNKDKLYYQVRQGGSSKLSTGGGIDMNGTNATGDSKWHTIAIVQDETTLYYYIDGAVHFSKAIQVVDGWNIGDLFKQNGVTEDTFAAHIGAISSGSASTYNLNGKLDFWQLYDGVLSASQIQKLTAASGVAETVDVAEWTDTVVANSVWAVVGADQMSGYLGETPNFSLFRLLNNGMRGGSNMGGAFRDIRMMNLAKPGQTVGQVVANFDAILGEHKSVYNVLMLLPELPEVHAAGYAHSADKVAAYKADIETLIKKNEGEAIVLWSPLASPNATINGYITEYANAVREIAAHEAGVLFFDANKFMNEKLNSNSSLSYNWFDDSMNITPLCATDLAYAFYVHADYPYFAYQEKDSNGNTVTKYADPTNKNEILSHNLRLSSDKRLYKSGVVKENLSYGVSVSGGTFTVDGSSLAGYTNLRVAVLPGIGAGSVVEPWILGPVGETLTAPHSNPVITVYGDLGGRTYRFKDVQLALTTGNNLTEPYTETSDLTALEVVGAPAIGFDPSKTTYDVELYQYQRQVRIVAEGGNNLTIKVNGQTVKPGDFSQYIAVDSSATVTVTVSGGAADKTYTLNLVKPTYPDIIITEVMTDGYVNYTKSGADNYELIEIYNASGRDLNLLDYSIGYLREYPYSNDMIVNGEIPYYFTGNDHNFFGNSYLGINQITKYSSYWADKVDQEPAEVIFPADSAMVIWVKFSKDAGTDYGSSLTYETLIDALNKHSGTHTLTVDVEQDSATVTKTVVPTLDQLVVAEIPYGAAQNNVTQNITTSATNFYMDGFQVQQNYENRRGWLFVLDDSAVRDYYGALTEAGNDIISAAKYVRPGGTDKLSSVMHYSTSRGLSIVKNPDYWDTNFSTGHTSSQQGYANLTSFGAVEYWQKPYDFGDTAAPSIENKTPAGVLSGDDATIELVIDEQEDGDIRYLELYVDTDNDGTYETVVKKDITLITSATNGGKAKDVVSHTETLSLTDLTNTVKYYGFVLDGNNNKAWLGSDAAPMTIEIVEPGQLRVNVNVLNEAGEASDAEIEVSITLSKGDSLINIGGNYVVYNAEGASVGNLNGGSGSVTVSNGEALIVKNLPEGAAYTLRVAVPNGYKDLTPTDNLTGKIGTTEGATTVSAQKILLTGNLTVSADIERVNGDSSSADTKATVVITLAKGSSPVELAESYVVEDLYTVKLGETVDNTITLSLADGQQATVIGLPVGAVYTVTATAPDGYEDKTTGSTNSALTSVDGATVALSFKEILVTGDLTVGASVKKVDGTASDKKATVKIDLTQGTAGIAPTGTYQLVSDKERTLPSVTNGTATFTMEDGEKITVKDLPVGTKYTISVTVPEGYENITQTALDGNVAEGGSIAAVAVKEKLITGGLTVNAVIKKVDGADSAEKVTVKIQLAKGDSPVNLEPSYTVVNGSGTELGTTTNGAITVTLGNGEKAVIADLPAGAAYTLTVTTPEGYANESTDATTGNVSANGSSVTVGMKELLVTGNLTVNAAVKKVDDSASAEKITVKIDLTKGNAPIDLEATYAIVDGAGASLGTITNGTATIQLANGQKAIVKDVAEGAAYTVTVTAPEGYENTTTGTTTGNVVKTGSAVDVSAKELLVTGDLTVNAEAKRVDNTASTEKITVKIDLTKGNAPINLEASYDIVDGSGTKIGTVTNGTATVELTNGQKAVVKDVAVGAAYTVTVTAPENYENTTAGATTGNVAETGSAVTVSVKELLVTGNLTVNAAVKKVDGATSSEKVTVKIDLTKDNAPVDLEASYDIVDGSGTKIGEVKNGTATIELTNGQKAIVKDVAVGAKFTVTVTAPSGYNDLTETTTGNVVKAGSTVNVSVKEKLITGTLTVNAEAKRVDNSASAEKITVKIKLAKGDAPVGLATTYTVVDGSGNELGKTSNGEITVKLENGEKAVITGLPAGAAYTVTVTAPENYENTTAGATTGNVAETGSAVTVSVKELLVTGNLTVNATVKEVDGDVSSEKVTVKIDLTKDNAPVDLEASYDIVEGSGTKIGEVKNGTATIEMTNGQKAIVKDVAVGAKFTVTVTAPDGYDDLTQNGTGNVVKTGSTVSVSVKEKLVTGTLTVKMDLNDCAGADADSSVKASLKIKVTKGDAAVALNASYDILNNKGVKIGTLANGEATVELANGGIAKIDGLPAGASYTVTVTVPEGYDDITTGATTGKVAAAGSDVTIALQEQVKEGQFYISASVKKVDGSASTAKATVVITLAKTNAPVDLADSYDILDENGTKIGSTANGTATLSMADGDKAVIKGLPEGASYSVKITAPTGYEDKTSAAATTGIIGTDSGAVACEVAEILKTGEVSVTAELKTEDGETVTDEKVTVTVTLSKGLSPVELAASYDIVNAKGEKIGTVSNGVATFKLASGEKATIKDLPQGAAFVVSLTTPEGYENTTTGTTSGNIAATPIVVSLKVTEKAPTETTKETDPTETTKAPSVTPPTGDTSGVGVWMVVMAASAVLLCLMAAVMALLGRKSKSRR